MRCVCKLEDERVKGFLGRILESDPGGKAICCQHWLDSDREVGSGREK